MGIGNGRSINFHRATRFLHGDRTGLPNRCHVNPQDDSGLFARLQLRFGALRERAGALCVGLGYKLLACPAMTVAVLWALEAGPDMVSRVTVIESAMPPMIGAGIVAAQARLDGQLVSLMIGIGIPLAFATVPAWNWLFKLIAVDV